MWRDPLRMTFLVSGLCNLPDGRYMKLKKNFFLSSTSLLPATHLPPPSCMHAQSCNPMDCSPPGSSVHGLFQARILEWVAKIYEIEIGNSRRDKTSIFPPRMFLCFLWGLRGQWQILRLWVRASPCHSLSPLRMYVYLYNTSQYSKSLWKNEFHSKSVFLSPICL